MKKDILANLYRKCLILCGKILLNVLHNLSLTVLLLWLHTGFQTSPIFKAFLATFGFPFSYLQMVPHIHDPTGIYLQHMANFLKRFHVFKFTYFSLNPNATTITWLNAIYLGSLCLPVNAFGFTYLISAF